MYKESPALIDDQTVETFQKDGVVLLKGVFKPWVDTLAQGISELMANPSEYGFARTVIPKDGSAPFSRIIATGPGSKHLKTLYLIPRPLKLPPD